MKQLFKDDQPITTRTGILFAIPGTTCRAAMGVYDPINRAAALRFPGVEPRWCFTSGPIRRKLSAQGLPAPDPAEALAAMHADGFTRVAVMPLHLSDGMEFGELAEVVKDSQHRSGSSMQVALGHALLTSETDWRRVLEALLAEVTNTLALGPGRAGATVARAESDERSRIARPEPSAELDACPDRIILVLHGSTDPRGAQTLQRAAEICRTVDPRLLPGMTIGKPDLAEVVRTCQTAHVKKAWLLPCMVVAGFAAREEIAGPGETSWASTLTRAGLEIVPIVKGLGEVHAIVQIWLDAVERMLTEL